MVVGTNNAHWQESLTHLNAARNATSVLPNPTSPHNNRSIGEESSMSCLISLIQRSWSSVSSNSKWASKSCCHSVSGEKACPFACIRCAYNRISSFAISFTAARTRAFVFCQSCPPNLLNLTVASSLGPIYLDTKSNWVTGTYRVSFFA